MRSTFAIGKAGASIYVARRLATDSRRGARLLRSFLAFINKDSIYVGVINTIGKAGASIYAARRLAADSRRGARLLRLFVAEGRTDRRKEGRKRKGKEIVVL